MNHAIPTKRLWRRWALVWVLVAMVLLPVGWAVVAVWVPYHRTQSLIRYVESVGGEVDTAVRLPPWLSALPLESLPALSGFSDAAARLFKTPRRVSLVETSVDDAGLAHFRGLTSLDYLDLSGTQVSDAGLVHLRGLKKLPWLFLADTQVSDAGLMHLRGMTSLKILTLQGSQVTPAGVNELRQSLPGTVIWFAPE